jgi:streptogramin lyase
MSSSIGLIIKKKMMIMTSVPVVVVSVVATLAVGTALLLSLYSDIHKTEGMSNSKFFAFASNITTTTTSIPASILGNESNKIDENNIQFYNSSHINSAYIKEYSMPNGTWPNGILVDKKGIVWTVGTKSQTLIGFDPKQGRIVSEYPIRKNSFQTTNKVQLSSSSAAATSSKQAKLPMMTWAMVEDNNDSSIWFSQADSPYPLWRFDPLSKRFDVIENISGAPYQMKVDDKTGDIWFTTYTGNKLGVIQKIEQKQSATTAITTSKNNSGNKTSCELHYTIKEFDLDRQAFPSGLYLDSPDSIWISQSLNDKLVHFKVVRDGINGKVINVVKTLEIPTATVATTPAKLSPFSSDREELFASPYDIVVHGTDLWVTEHDANFLTKYNIPSHTLIKFPTSSNPHQYLSLPFWLRPTKDGHGLWFNEHYGNRIAFFDITNTTLTEYEIPTRNQSLGYIGNALNIAIDPTDSNNKLWFSEYNHDKIGVVDRTVPIPFNIHSPINNKVIIFNTTATSRGQNQQQQQQQHNRYLNKQPLIIDFDVSRNSSIQTHFPMLNKSSSSNIIFFKLSSSTSPYGLLNGNASFSKDNIDLTKLKESEEHLQLLVNPEKESDSLMLKLKVENNPTIGISATDGIVTKSIFLSLLTM